MTLPGLARIPDGMSGTDAEISVDPLWARASRGDVVGREELAVAVLDLARPVLRVFGAPTSDLDDLAQATVLSVFRYMESRSDAPPRHLGAFVKWRARGVLSDHRKAHRARPLEYTADPLEPPPSYPAESPLSRLLARRTLEDLAECRRELARSTTSGKYAEVVAHRYDSHLDNHEIAELQGANVRTVAVQVHRALSKLKDCLRRKGHEL